MKKIIRRKGYRKCNYCGNIYSERVLQGLPRKRRYNLIKGIKNRIKNYIIRKGEEWSEY